VEKGLAFMKETEDNWKVSFVTASLKDIF